MSLKVERSVRIMRMDEYKLFCTVSIEPRKTYAFQNYNSIDLENCHHSDIINGFMEVQSKGSDLEDYIDPENELLNRLYNQRIIDNSEVDILESVKPYQKLNGELLRKITITIDSISKQFIQALCQDEQDHIAKFIVTAGCETDSDERLLPRELRKIIDDNMFCLKKLIDTEKLDFLMKLVTTNCIRAWHRDRVIHSKPDDKAYELLIILQRRRYKDFFNFMECLRKTMQNNIATILEKGGITEIKVQLLQKRSDKRNIEAELINKLTGYVDEDNESELREDQKKIVNELLTELAENGISFIGTCPDITTSKGGLSMFFQGETNDSCSFLKSGSESGSLKNTLEKLFLSLLKIPNSWPPLVIKVTTGKHSYKHHVGTKLKMVSHFISNTFNQCI